MVLKGKYIHGKGEENLEGKEFSIDLPLRQHDDYLIPTQDNIIYARIPTRGDRYAFISTETSCDRFHPGAVIRVNAANFGYPDLRGEFEFTL